MRISATDIRKVVEILLEHLEKIEQGVCETNRDFYWDVPSSERYDQYGKPSDLTVGQLSDDWAELKGILSGDKEPIGYGLVWLGNILRAWGDESKG